MRRPVEGAGPSISPADYLDLPLNDPNDASTYQDLVKLIAHHQGALTMAQDEIKNGQFPDAIAMAKAILDSQQKEIDTMKSMLSCGKRLRTSNCIAIATFLAERKRP